MLHRPSCEQHSLRKDLLFFDAPGGGGGIRARKRAQRAEGSPTIPVIQTGPERGPAEEEGFEPTVPLRVRRFSKPVIW